MGSGVRHVGSDAENGTYVLLEHEGNGLNNREENYFLPVAVKCSYVFQAIFQVLFLSLSSIISECISLSFNIALLLQDCLSYETESY